MRWISYFYKKYFTICILIALINTIIILFVYNKSVIKKIKREKND